MLAENVAGSEQVAARAAGSLRSAAGSGFTAVYYFDNSVGARPSVASLLLREVPPLADSANSAAILAEGPRHDPDLEHQPASGRQAPPLLLYLAIAAVTVTGAVALLVGSSRIDGAQPVTRVVTGTSEPRPPDATSAIADLRGRAQQGDVEAEVALAQRYRDGAGVPRNEAAALEWYKAAASQGYPAAQYAIGEELASAPDGLADLVGAYVWLVLAKTGGQAASQSALDAVGRRLTPSEILDVRLRLGQSFEYGIGTAADPESADVWYLLGESSGDARGRRHRFVLESHMTRQEIAAARARAADWLRRHNSPVGLSR